MRAISRFVLQRFKTLTSTLIPPIFPSMEEGLAAIVGGSVGCGAEARQFRYYDLEERPHDGHAG